MIEKLDCIQNRIIDNDIIKFGMEEIGFELVKANFYIKFSEERVLKIFSRIPNTTVIVVKKTKSSIDKNSLKIVLRGSIEK